MNYNCKHQNKAVKKQSKKMQDMITQKYQFTIIPLQITTKPLSMTQTPKSIIIKLGQSVAKTSNLNTPLKLVVQVLYSKTKKKYCPIKGIIKIYDIMEDENQIISCVGTFQTQDILQQKITKQIITKNIGSTTLKMEVSAKLHIQQSKLEVQPQLMKQSISQVSSQRMIQNSDGSHHIIGLQDSLTQQTDQIRQLRRVNTLNPGQAYQTTDVIDLKSAINFGPSRSIHNSISCVSGLASSNNKLQMKANILHKNNLKQHQSVRYSQNRNNSPQAIKAAKMTKNLYTIPRINAKSSLDEFYKQEDSDQNSQVMSGIDLQLQSRKSKQMIEEKKQKQLKVPPLLSLPVYSKLNLATNCTNGLQNTNMKIDEFGNQNNDDNRVSPLMMGSFKRIPSDQHEQIKNTNNHLSASKYSIRSGNSNGNADSLIKSIYDLAFIPEMDSNRDIMLSSTFINNDNNNNKNINNGNNMDLSMSNASLTTSVMNEYQKMEIQTLGEQLIEERRKNLQYERKIEKYHFKIVAYKQKYHALLHQWDQWCYHGQKFLENISTDANGQHLIEINKAKERISMKYNINNESQTAFMNFLKLTIQNSLAYHKNQAQNVLKTQTSQISQRKTRLASQISQISSPQINQVLQKIESTYACNTKLVKVQQQLNEQIQSMTQNLMRAQKNLKQSQVQRMRLQEQMAEQQKNIEHLNFQLNSISGINTYLKQKDQQMENIISLKQNTIDNMKKILQENNVELDELEEEISQCKKAADNKELMLEEMREELADKEQIIQLYREVYGEINRYSRNKDADLEIQSCIRTIIENNRIDANPNYYSTNIETIDEDLNQENISEVISIHNDNMVNANNKISRTNTKNNNRRSLSIQESVSLVNSIGISRQSIPRNSLGSRDQKDSKEDKSNYQRNLLLSVIRNNERIHRFKPEEVKIIHSELKNLYKRIEDYINKLEAPNKLFHSME